MKARLLVLTALTTCLTGIQTSRAQDLAEATFAGGCFWCIEAPFDQVEGVAEAVSGYTGGERENPSYEEVSSGATRHIESVLVTFDPEVVSYSQLLDVFWRQFDPTDAGGSFYDRGHQYTSAIFYHDEEQRILAEASKRALDASGRFDKPIVTPIRPATTFYPAEEYHQDYYLKNSRHYKRYRRDRAATASLRRPGARTSRRQGRESNLPNPRSTSCAASSRTCSSGSRSRTPPSGLSKTCTGTTRPRASTSMSFRANPSSARGTSSDRAPAGRASPGPWCRTTSSSTTTGRCS